MVNIFRLQESVNIRKNFLLHRSCFRYALIGWLGFYLKSSTKYYKKHLYTQRTYYKDLEEVIFTGQSWYLCMYISKFFCCLSITLLPLKIQLVKTGFASSINTNQWVTTKYIQQVWDGIISTNCSHRPHSKALKRFLWIIQTTFNGLSTND